MLRSCLYGGNIEPIIITQDKIIVSGHQRVRAAKELGMTLVPIKIDDDLQDETSKLRALISNNFGRRKNDPAKDRKALATYVELKGYGQGRPEKGANLACFSLDEIAKELNMSKRNLQRALRIERNLTDSMKELLDTGEITKTFASDTIASLSEEEQEELLKKLPNRSKTAILSKAHDLGLTSERSIDWSKEDDEKLYLFYPELGSKMFEQLPNKTNMQIIRRIKQLGVKKENPFIAKMKLVHNALNEGVVISKQNQYYKNVNLYEWCIYNRKKFSEKELEIINQVIPNKKLQIAIKVVDCETKKSNIYPSKTMAARALHESFHILKSKESIKDAIQRRISGQVTTPYKGRFMFYYATDEEVKKYLEDSKVS